MENLNKKQKKVFVLAGPPGTGKSTWTIKQMQALIDSWISRDNIRFMLLNPNDDYFARETEVRNTFYETIYRACRANDSIKNIYIDATHLTQKSRAATLRKISADSYKIAVSFEAPVAVALERNAQRTGRALVPESVIYSMYESFTRPKLAEGFDEIWHVDADGNIRKEVKNE